MTAPLLIANPIVKKNGTMAREFEQWVRKANLSVPIPGAGSPEGTVEADQYALYLDTGGGTGTTQYRKMLPDIAGDALKGWVLM